MAYSDLQTQIATWLVRDDLTAQIPQFISLAENRLNRVLFVPERETVSTSTATGEKLALPADFWGMRSIYVDASPRQTLAQMSLAEMRNQYRFGVTGTPTHYAIEANELVFAPTPATDTNLVLNYWATIPALSDDAPTNWLLTAYPDLYLAASLVEAYVRLRDNDATVVWKARTDEKISEMLKAGQRKLNGAAPLAPRGAANIWRVRA